MLVYWREKKEILYADWLDTFKEDEKVRKEKISVTSLQFPSHTFSNP